MSLEKPLDEIAESDLQILVDNQADESLVLEFKRELPTNNKEIAKDVSSMANAKGGFLIYGIGEDDNNRASELVGVETKGTKEKIENIILSSIQPKLEVDIKPIPLQSGSSKAAILLSIPESTRAPHMVSAGGEYRYYRRRNFQASMMEEFEVRELYSRTVDLSKRVEDFLLSKGYGLLDPNKNGEPWKSILICPMLLQDDLVKIDNETRDFVRNLPAMYQDDLTIFWRDLEPSVDGFECVGREREPPELIYRTFELNRNGFVQMARRITTNPPEEKKIFAYDIALQLINGLLFASRLYDRIAYLGNVKVILGLNNIPAFELARASRGPFLDRAALRGRSTLLIPRDKYSGTLSTQAEHIAKDMMDQLYNAFGLMKSDVFDDSGKFRPLR